MREMIDKYSIRKDVPIATIARALGVEYRNGWSPCVQCPACKKFRGEGGERPYVCRIWKTHNVWKCFSCGGFGDNIQFYMLTQNVDFATALFDLRDMSEQISKVVIKK